MHPSLSIMDKTVKVVAVKRAKVDADLVFSALLKLSFIFEVEESLMLEMVTKICDPNYINIEERYKRVKKWTNNIADEDLQCEEVLELIKYVQLYEKSSAISSNTIEKWTDINMRCRLMCPFRCEMAPWTAEIRHEEKLLEGCGGSDSTDSTFRLDFRRSLNGEDFDEYLYPEDATKISLPMIR